MQHGKPVPQALYMGCCSSVFFYGSESLAEESNLFTRE